MGKLVLVTVPIGNDLDITQRAKDALTHGTYFFAEDTRVFKELLLRLGIGPGEKTIDSFHDHTDLGGNLDAEQVVSQEAIAGTKTHAIFELIKRGETVYLVSDAGSPVISDPAYPLLKAAKSLGLEVDTLPGVSSLLTALELSLFPTNPFFYWGFLPRGESDKRRHFEQCFHMAGTHVFFESPHRVLETLNTLKQNFPQVEIAVARELTKKFQSVYRGKITEMNFENIILKGEFVIVVYLEKSFDEKFDSELQLLFQNKLSDKNLAKFLAKFSKKLSASEIYEEFMKNRG